MAANTEMIDALVSDSALKNLDTLNTKLASSYAEMEKLLGQVQELSNGLSKAGNSFGDVSKLIERQTKVEQSLTAVEKEQIRLLNEKEKLQAKITTAYSQEALEVEKLRKLLNNISTVRRNIIKEQESQTGSTEKLRAQINLLNNSLDRMGEKTRNSALGKAMVEDVAEMNKQVLALEASTGRFGRNVGNYASGFNGLGMSVQQVARELPSLTMGANMFFLAISNNLPILTDELKRAKTEYKSAIAEGKAATPVWKQLLSSILSWQTAMVIGITLLAAYGKEIGNWINSTSKAINIQEKLTEKMENNNFGSQIVSLKKLQKAWNELGSDLKTKEQFIIDNKNAFEGLGVSVNDVKDAENLLVDNTDAFIKSLKKRAEATAAQELAVEGYRKYLTKMQEANDEAAKSPSFGDKLVSAITKGGASTGANRSTSATNVETPDANELWNNRISSIRQEAEALKSTADAYFDLSQNATKAANSILNAAGITEFTENANKQLKAQQDLLKEKEKFLEEERKLKGDNDAFVTRMQADSMKDIAANEKEALENRLKAVEDYHDKLKASIEESRKNQVAVIEKQVEELGLTTEQGAEHIRMINQKAASEQIKLDNETNKIRLDIAQDSEQEFLKNSLEAINKRNDAINAEMQAKLIEAAQNYKTAMESANSDEERNKILEDYQKDRIRIIKDYNQQALDEEIKLMEELLLLTDISEEEKEKIRKRIDDIRKKNAKETAEFEIKQTEESANSIKKVNEKIAEELEKFLNDEKTKAVLETWGVIFDTVSMYYDMQIEKIDELEKREQEYYEDKLKTIDENVEAGLMSEEEADARRRILEETQLEREKQFEQKRKEMQRKQAVWQKANSIVQATIAGAQAVIVAAAAPFPLGLVLPAIIGAMVAAQIAMIASQQIPSYAKGTDDHPGGLARVGDGGRSEMVILPSGEIWKTPAKDTFVNLPKGTEVLPDYRKAMIDMCAVPTLSYYDDDSGQTLLLHDAVLRNNTKETNNQLSSINRGINVIRRNSLYSNRKNNLSYRFISNNNN